MELAQALYAGDKVVAYATECLAREVHKSLGGEAGPFSLELQFRLKAVSRIVDKHIEPGPHTIAQRRAFLQKVEIYCEASPAHDPRADDDNEAIAKALNGVNELGKLPLALVHRELGRKVDLSDVQHLPDHPLTSEAAQTVVSSLNHVLENLQECVRTIDDVFHDQRDKVPFFPHLIAREKQIVSQELEQRPVQPVLDRFEAIWNARQARAKDLESLFTESPSISPSPSPTHQIAGRRRKWEELSPDISGNEAPASFRRRFDSSSSSPAPEILDLASNDAPPAAEGGTVQQYLSVASGRPTPQLRDRTLERNDRGS